MAVVCFGNQHDDIDSPNKKPPRGAVEGKTLAGGHQGGVSPRQVRTYNFALIKRSEFERKHYRVDHVNDTIARINVLQGWQLNQLVGDIHDGKVFHGLNVVAVEH